MSSITDESVKSVPAMQGPAVVQSRQINQATSGNSGHHGFNFTGRLRWDRVLNAAWNSVKGGRRLTGSSKQHQITGREE